MSLLVLYLFNPSQFGFYPRCVFHSWTGLDCPGCGGLRATHQLLHGNLRAALRLNALFILLLPVGAYFGTRYVVLCWAGKTLPQPFKSPRWPVLLGALVIGFGVLRNLPWRTWFGS